MARPQTLADVARHARERKADFALALDEFVDEFYLDHPDKAAQQRRLDAVPEAVGDALIDGFQVRFLAGHLTPSTGCPHHACSCSNRLCISSSFLFRRSIRCW